MKNIYIERKDMQAFLKENVFKLSAGSSCYSLIGPNGVGKTTLINRMAEDFNAKYQSKGKGFCFSAVLRDGMSLWGFWAILVRKFSGMITKKTVCKLSDSKSVRNKILVAYDFFKKENDYLSDRFLAAAPVYLSSLFDGFTKLGIRLIVTIDEFDRAERIFGNGEFFQMLYDLSEKGGSGFDLSIVTVSRKRGKTIVHNLDSGAEFEDAFAPLTLGGFTNAELRRYFSLYKRLPCGAPDEKTRSRILYLCGRCPALLMKMYENALMCAKRGKPDIDSICCRSGEFLRTSFDRMIDLMRKEYVDKQKETDLLSIFTQYFIGPVYTDNFSEYYEKLLFHGFALEADEESFVLSDVSADMEAPLKKALAPISPYLVDYVRWSLPSEERDNLDKLLRKAELTVREALADEMRKKLGDSWKDELANDKKKSYLSQLINRADENNFDKSEFSMLDVMSFNDHYDTIKRFDLFDSDSFRLFDREELQNTLSALNSFRNTYRHLNGQIYNAENRKNLSLLCQKLIDGIENSRKKERPKTSVSESASPMTGQRTVMHITECFGKDSVRGILTDTGAPVFITRKSMKNRGLNAKGIVGQDIEVIVGHFCNNPAVNCCGYMATIA